MTLEFKNVYNSITDKIGAGAHEAYKAVREAIDTINSKGFLKESLIDFAPGHDGTSLSPNDYHKIDLKDADNQVIKVLAVRDPQLTRMKRKETLGEYINKFAEEGEPVYEQIGDIIYVYPKVDYSFGEKEGTVGISGTDDEEIVYDSANAPLDDTFGLEVGDKLYVYSPSDSAGNVVTIKAFATDSVSKDTITVNEKGLLGSDGDTVKLLPAYTVVGHQILNNFPSSYDSSESIEVKHTFVPAIRYLTLSILTGLIDKNYTSPELSQKYYELYIAELEILLKNESIYKE